MKIRKKYLLNQLVGIGGLILIGLLYPFGIFDVPYGNLMMFILIFIFILIIGEALYNKK